MTLFKIVKQLAWLLIFTVNALPQRLLGRAAAAEVLAFIRERYPKPPAGVFA